MNVVTARKDLSVIDHWHLRTTLVACLIILPVACRHPDGGIESPRPDRAGTVETDAKVILGVRMGPPGETLSRAMRVDPQKTTIINHVAPGTPALEGGLEQWDLVVGVNGSDDASPAMIRRVLRTSHPGDILILDIIRKGEPSRIGIVLEAAEDHRKPR